MRSNICWITGIEQSENCETAARSACSHTAQSGSELPEAQTRPARSCSPPGDFSVRGIIGGWPGILRIGRPGFLKQHFAASGVGVRAGAPVSVVTCCANFGFSGSMRTETEVRFLPGRFWISAMINGSNGKFFVFVAVFGLLCLLAALLIKIVLVSSALIESVQL